MRVLMVASGNDQPECEIAPFVYEQTLTLLQKGIEVEIFPIIGKGFLGYLRAAFRLNKLLKEKEFNIIHGHYIMAALVTILQFKVPVVTSFIGSDINDPKNRLLSRLTVFNRAKSLIFVSEKLQKISGYKKKSFVIPYGLDLNKFFPIDKKEARKHLHWSDNELYIFFSSRFDRVEKNSQLAFAAIEKVKQKGILCKLIEFRNIKSEDLNFYYSASDLFLLTSIYEGSPQCIKEAIACNCPIVSSDVGDVKWVIGNIKGNFIASLNVDDITDKIIKSIEYSAKYGRVKSRERILELGLDAENAANRLIEVYQKVVISTN
jgi:teichuronic acid biosynthesis glycosyltransferase TuaC